MRHSDEEQSKDEIRDESTHLALELSQQQYSGLGGDPRKQLAAFTGFNYLAITRKAMVGASSEPVIYDKRLATDDESEERHGRADSKFRWWALLEDASPWQTQEQLMIEVIQQLGIHGTSMVWNVKNGWGKTTWRIPVPISLITPFSRSYRADMPYGGIRVNPVQSRRFFFSSLGQAMNNLGWSNREISFEDLTITAFPHPELRGDGYSPTTAMARWIELVDLAEKCQSDQYKRGANMRVLLPYIGANPTPTTQELDASQRKYEQRFQDSDSNVVVVPPGTVAQPITMEPDSMQYSSASQTYSESIMAGHGVSRAVAGMQDGMTYGSLAAAHQSFVANVLQPTLNLIAAEDTASMRKEEGTAFYIKYIAPKVSDPEIEQRDKDRDVQKAQIAVGVKFVRVDELRTMLGLKPLGGEEGQVFIGDLEAANQPPAAHPGAPAGQPPGAIPPDMPQPEEKAVEGVSEGKMVARLEAKRKSIFRQEAMVPRTENERAPVIAFDLDGTLAEPTEFYQPGVIGKPNMQMVEITRMVRDAGCNVVVYTARNEDREVMRWLDDCGVPFCAINENPYMGQAIGGAKMLFDVLVDDRVTDARTTEGIVLKGIADHVHPDWAEKIYQRLKGSTIEQRYGFLFAPVAGALAEKVRGIQAKIDRKHLAGTGIESELHITVLYGMVGEDEGDVARIMSQVKQPSFKLGNSLSILGQRPSENGQVALVVELDSVELQGLYSIAARSFPHISSHPTYKPHITLAYIDEKYAGEYSKVSVTRVSSKVDQLVYRHQHSPDLIIPLKS